VKLLSAEGFESYLPLIRTLSQWSDRRKLVELPLFPGYLFVRCALDAHVRTRLLGSSRSTLAIVGSGSRAVPVPAVEIESIRTLLASESPLSALDRVPRGARVKVVDGPLAGVEGVVVSQKGKRRIVCAVELLGRSVRADLNAGDVVAAA